MSETKRSHNSHLPSAVFRIGLKKLIGNTLCPLMLYKRGCLLYETGARVHMQQAFVCTEPDVQPLLRLQRDPEETITAFAPKPIFSLNVFTITLKSGGR